MSEEFMQFSSVFALVCSMVALGYAVFIAVKGKAWTRGTVVMISMACLLLLLSIRAEVLHVLSQNAPAACTCPQRNP